jgi:hypothetical protein
MSTCIRKRLRRLTAIAASCCVVSALMAVLPPLAAADASSVLLWGDLTTIYRIDERWRYDGDLGVRGDLSARKWTSAYIRPSVRNQVTPWFRVHAGLGFAYAWIPDVDDLLEIRPWLGFNAAWPRVEGFVFSHYVRIEQRNIRAASTGEWLSDLRGRYRLQTTSPDYRFLHRTFFLASLEFFLDIEGAFADLITKQSRVVLGAGDRVSDRWRLEVHYIRQNSQVARTATFDVREHIIRLRLFTSFN